jgi:hypothetical chaperone protein
MALSVGLDFGTSNSGLAVYDGKRVNLLPIDRANILPEVVKSILYITRENECYIGQEAIELYYRHNVNRPRKFVRKRAGEIEYFGGDMEYVNDAYVYVDELQPGRLMQYLKTALRKSKPGGYEGTLVFEHYYRVADLVRTYLGLLKHRAEEILGETIHAVTLGRPVKFSESRELDKLAEETLRKAALEAGFAEVDFELEPVAAALFYEQSITRPENVLIFDFGGGTLDIAILRLGDGDNRPIYASGGIDIAGSDFDRAIIQKRLLPYFGLGRISHQPDILELIQAVPEWMSLPDLATPQNRNVLEKTVRSGTAPVQIKALQALIYNDLSFLFYNHVEAAKIALSRQGAVVIELKGDDIDLWELYTRHQFEFDIRGYQKRVEKVLLDTLAASGLAAQQIDAVVKTGGSSSIPLFSEMLVRIFGKEKVRESNVFSSVVAGLAIRAGSRG